MGNVNGREEGVEIDDDPSSRSNGPHRLDRVASSDSLTNSPPATPDRSRSPLLFSPQEPVVPLQRSGGLLPLNQSHRVVDYSFEQGIPTIIRWNYGGNDVAVEGSWDNWTSKKILQRSKNDHSVVLLLPSGIYHYKFVVDGKHKYAADLPFVVDEMGHCCNVHDVQEFVPDNLDSVAEFEAPPSPHSSYSQDFMRQEDFAKEPAVVPSQLHLTVLGMDNTDGASKPQHVVLNHVFIEKGWASESIVALGLTHRFESRYITVALYKPLIKSPL